MVNVNGGVPKRLTFDPAADQNPFWSHDGRWIYFDSTRNGLGIWKVPVQGGEALPVFATPAGVQSSHLTGGFFITSKLSPERTESASGKFRWRAGRRVRFSNL